MRGYDTRYPFPSDRPAYLTHSYEVANGYANEPHHALAHVETMRDLRVLDLRCMIAAIRIMFAERTRVDEESDSAIRTISLAYGVCSLNAQIDLSRNRYREALTNGEPGIAASIESMQRYLHDNQTRARFPVEVPGVRVAETSNDTDALLVLKRLFTDFDGYIAPRMLSPFHVDQRGLVPAELVLFEPKASLRRIQYDEMKSWGKGKVFSFQLHTLRGAHAEMRPVNDGLALGLDRVWMRGGCGGKKKAAKAKASKTLVFDPCGIDRIPKAEYRRMCTRAKQAAGAFVIESQKGGGGGGYDTFDVSSFFPESAPFVVKEPTIFPSSQNPWAVSKHKFKICSGLETNLLEAMTDEEYEALQSRLGLGRAS